MRMGKLLAFCFAFLIATSAFSQVKDSVPLIIADSLKAVYIYADTGKAINRIDAQGRKQGLWEKRYPNGKLRYRGHFFNDNPSGVFKYYWDNDSIQNISVYSKQGKVAYTQMFYENGGLLSIGKFIDKKRDSIWLFYDWTYKLYKKEQYVMSKKEGKSITFFGNGNVEEIKTWHNDLENGPWQRFFVSGQLQLDGAFVNGKMEGSLKVYSDGDPNAAIEEGLYHNDKKEGRWIYHNSETNKVDTLIYKDDNLLNGAKYQLTPRKLDSIKMQNQQLQQKLDNPGSIEDEYQRNGGH
jgi:antitoxin component YwqK of YwqJK toxin-antitoxin module